jgi:hypothetical protein
MLCYCSYDLTATAHFPTRVQNQSNTAVDNIFIDNYKFTKYILSLVYNGLSDHDAQLLTIKDINLQTVNLCSYSIRNINNYSMEEFKIWLSYESWDSIFSNNDNTDVDSLFNIFLNNYLKIVYTSFPLQKIIERGKSRQLITKGIKTSFKRKRQLHLLSKDTNDINLIKYYKQYCKILARVITETKRSKYNNQIINSTNKIKTTWNIIKSEINRLKGHTVFTKFLLTPLMIISYP